MYMFCGHAEAVKGILPISLRFRGTGMHINVGAMLLSGHFVLVDSILFSLGVVQPLRRLDLVQADM